MHCMALGLEDKGETKKVLVSSFGAIEKNTDVVIGRRFKGQGMSWTKQGANNLLKPRILRYDKDDWEGFWERQKLAGVSFSPLIYTTEIPPGVGELNDV